LLLGLGLGLAVSVLIEVGRRIWQWQIRRARRRDRRDGGLADRPSEPGDRPATAGVTTRWPG
jgi:hypothetical protein